MSHFDKNINALQQRNPALAKQLMNAPAVDKNPLLPVSPNQIQQQLQQLKQNSVKHIVLIGVGSGRILQGIQSVINPINTIVIEPNHHPLSKLLHEQDITSWLQDETMFWVSGADLHSIPSGLTHAKTALAADGYHLIVNPEAGVESSPEVQAIVQAVQQVVQQETYHLRLRLARADLCQTNLSANLPVMLQSLSIDDLKDIGQDIPALIVAAGPSLNQSVCEIKQIKDRVLLIAVDTAVRTLLANDIYPQIVVTSDPSPANAKHFEDVNLPKDTTIAFIADCHKSIIEKHQSYPLTLCLWDNSTHLTYWMQKQLGFHHVFQRPLNVSEAAVRLALHFGCHTILFCGLDLALPPQGGTTHAHEASHSFVVMAQESSRIKVKKRDDTEEWLPVVSAAGWDEEQLYTYPSFQMYLQELESIIAQNPIQWVDCTIGGAKKRGCERIGLYDAAAQYGAEEPAIKQCIAAIQNTNKPDTKNCIQSLFDAIELLQAYQSKLQSIIDGNIHLQDGVEIWKAFIKEPTVRALLDHAVFRFQLVEPVERIAQEKQREFMIHHAKDALQILSVYIQLIEHSLKPLRPNP